MTPEGQRMKNRSITQFAVPAGVVGIVLLLVVPLPAPMLDVLLAVNITASLVILLTSMYVRRPLDFSVFPSLILVFTLFRLGLNVASTRLVLRDGYAGAVIDAFGHFVVGGSLVIGLVIFLILVVIQFVVITNGAGTPLIGRLLLFEALNTEFTELKVKRDPDCPICGPDAPELADEDLGKFPDYDAFCAG